MKLTALSPAQQNKSAKNYPAFKMNLETSEKAMSYFEKRIGNKIEVGKRLDSLKNSFKELTANDKTGKAVIDIEESSDGLPELIINGLKCNKYPVSVVASDTLPDSHSIKHLLVGGYRIMGENGCGYKNNNLFYNILKNMRSK